MTFNEKTLWELLTSPYGQSCGHAFLDCVQSGRTLTIHFEDGSSVIISDKAKAVEVLRDKFKWVLDGR